MDPKTLQDVKEFLKNNPEYHEALLNHYKGVIDNFLREIAFGGDSKDDEKMTVQMATIRAFILDALE